MNSSWLFVMESFGWREFRDRRKLGVLAGLTPTPHQCGDSLPHGSVRLRSEELDVLGSNETASLGSEGAMSLRGVVIAVVVVATVGCAGAGILEVLPRGSTPEGIGFAVRDTLFGPGDSITLALTNGTAREIGYNLCLGRLERWDGKSWRSVQRRPDDSECTLPLYHLTPGDSVQYRQPVYAFIEGGTYRFRDSIEWLGDGSRAEVISNGFRVR